MPRSTSQASLQSSAGPPSSAALPWRAARGDCAQLHRTSIATAGAPDPGKPPRTGQRGLDWFNFFVADIQTGFGPFLSVYLTTQKWTQVDIGLVLSIGSIAGLLAQVPGGWVVDLARSKLRAAGLAVIAIGI